MGSGFNAERLQLLHHDRREPVLDPVMEHLVAGGYDACPEAFPVRDQLQQRLLSNPLLQQFDLPFVDDEGG